QGRADRREGGRLCLAAGGQQQEEGKEWGEQRPKTSECHGDAVPFHTRVVTSRLAGRPGSRLRGRSGGHGARIQLRDSAGLAPASPVARRPFGGGTRRGLRLVTSRWYQTARRP